MSFEGSESENDGPQEEAKRKSGQYQMDDNDFSDEEDKPKKVQSAKTKAWNKLQLHSIDLVNHAKNHQFIDCREDLAQINNLLKVPQHAKYFDGVIFPKWFVKHVGNTLQDIQNFGKEESEKLIKEEGLELKKLKRTDLFKFGAEQIELFRKVEFLRLRLSSPNFFFVSLPPFFFFFLCAKMKDRDTKT
ncbi:hypothetical protein RFI_09930 [Reticulomyxa filosa]|uniref:Uncharacterized protein n=1 Tax=Reticulomyxa filosa TaxID=46433 RepID=X6NLN8_RETFI|nr:hypothetical protein RFI_09930 [Reticulomyxa filosa]|eukprot:ETO27205.1 hypothetical protein RFI_09930 [Reticulomyxa filosa]